MDNKMEFVSVMDIEGYRIEAISEPENLNEVTLWVTKPGADLKMKMGKFNSDIVGELTLLMITDMVNKNLEMKKFDFNCLVKSAISEGLIERNPVA
nr:hypothetical protein [uncultured Anaerosporobacter sp.]